MNNLTKLLIEDLVDKNIAIFSGGMKPPTSGHFLVAQKALENNPNIDKFIIFVGSGVRDGINQEQSIKIWNIYKKYLSPKVEILAAQSPVTSTYNYAKENPNENIIWIVGTRDGEEKDQKDTQTRIKAAVKYSNLKPQKINTTGGVSGTKAREALRVGKEEFFKFVPKELSEEDKEAVYNIVKKQVDELDQSEIKYWATFASVYDALKKDPDKVYNFLKEKLKGEQLKALDYFYNTYFSEGASLLKETKDLIPGGLAKGKSLVDIAIHHGNDSWASIQFESLEKQLKKQLEKGIKVEMEHTTDPNIAREIAMDHLWEDPKYYDNLEKIELKENLSNYKIYLDDERIPKFEGWTIVRSVDDFKKLINKKGLPKEISFDHDLGNNVPTGYDAMQWLVNDKEFDLRNVNINVHSANPVGKENIEGLLKSWNKFLDKEKPLNESLTKQNLKNYSKQLLYLEKLVEYCCKDLNIEKKPTIKIVGKKYIDENKSFGGYMPGQNKIYLVVNGRNLKDCCVTLAHEYFHFYQDQNNLLKPGAGKDGDEFENQANAYAGKTLRKFGRENPEIFELNV